MIRKKLNDLTLIESPDAIIGDDGYAYLCFSNLKIVRFLKEKSIELNLPVLRRKWSRIDENRVSKYEKSEFNKKNVISLYKNGLTQKEICEKLSLSKGRVSIILKLNESIKNKNNRVSQCVF